MVLSIPKNDEFSIDVGEGDVYLNNDYSYPWFFECSNRKMMKDPKTENVISIKTWKKEIFQFSLDTFHKNKCLLLTSTLLDCAFFPATTLSLEKAKDKASKAASEKKEIKGSFSGYFTYGRKMLVQYATLEKHMEEQGIYFTDETLEKIYHELLRRAKHE